MKLLYIGSIFSGLESSVLSGTWAPTGVPTIYKMIEALDASSHEVRIVLADRQTGLQFAEGWRRDQPTQIRLRGLKTPVKIVPHVQAGATIGRRIRSKISTVRQLWWLMSEAHRFQPDLVYVDRGNLLAGAVITRILRRPTVLRVMGIYPAMWEVLKARGLTSGLIRWAFRSPFSFVLCTQDGTNGAGWLDAALAPEVPRAMMLNGVAVTKSPRQNLPAALLNIPKNRIVVLFVGRLEEIKGWREFVRGILAVPARARKNIHAVIIGRGAGQAELESMIKKAGAGSMFTRIDRIAHTRIQAARELADIYVSLNKLGNLSNANLECFADGMCVVMPNSDPVGGADISTDRLVPEGAVVRIDRERLAESLAGALERFIDKPAEITRLQNTMRALSGRLLSSWEDRVSNEMALLEAIAAGRDLTRWTENPG